MSNPTELPDLDIPFILRQCADALAYAAYNYDGSKLEDLDPRLSESTGVAETALIAERSARHAIAALARRAQPEGEAPQADVPDLRSALGAVDDQLVAILNGRGDAVLDKLKAARNDLVRIWLELSRAPGTSEASKADAARIDHIEEWREAGKKRGFSWNSYDFMVDVPIRQQLDTAIQRAAQLDGGQEGSKA